MKTTTVTLLVGLLIAPAATASPPADPAALRARTEALVAAFEAVQTPPEGGKLTPEQRRANARAFERLDDFFDWETLSTKPFAPHRSKLSAKQYERLVALLRDTVRWVSYPDSGALFRQARWKITGVGGADGSEVTMHIADTRDDVETDVTFHWGYVRGAWRLVDVRFDGASLVLDYQNQFGRILAKHGAADLLRRLQKRHDAELAAREGLLP